MGSWVCWSKCFVLQYNSIRIMANYDIWSYWNNDCNCLLHRIEVHLSSWTKFKCSFKCSCFKFTCCDTCSFKFTSSSKFFTANCHHYSNSTLWIRRTAREGEIIVSYQDSSSSTFINYNFLNWNQLIRQISKSRPISFYNPTSTITFKSHYSNWLDK